MSMTPPSPRHGDSELLHIELRLCGEPIALMFNEKASGNRKTTWRVELWGKVLGEITRVLRVVDGQCAARSPLSYREPKMTLGIT